MYVNVRDAATNRVLVERHLPYETRRVQLGADDWAMTDGAQLQLCVQAKSSDGSIGSWFDAQCFALPADFAAVRKRYTARFNGVFTMLSSRPPRGGAGGRRADKRSSSTRLMSNCTVFIWAIIAMLCKWV